MTEFNYIDLKLMEKICHPFAVEFFDKKEDPIAKFSEHELSLLDSALNNPRYRWYPDLANKSAILYYSLIKNHPFRNGNKRIATATLLVFLYINNYWLNNTLKENEDYLVKIAIEVADSKGSSDKDRFLQEISSWLEKHIIQSDDHLDFTDKLNSI